MKPMETGVHREREKESVNTPKTTGLRERTRVIIHVLYVYRGDRQRRAREQTEEVGTVSGVQASDSVVKCQQQHQSESSHQKSSKSRINKRTK